MKGFDAPLDPAMEAAPFGVALVQIAATGEAGSFQLLHLNPAFCRALGVARTPEPGTRLRQLEAGHPLHRFDWPALARDPGAAPRHLWAPGRQRWYKLSAFRPQKDRLMLMLFDVDAEMRAAEKLEQRPSALQERLMQIATKYINIELADLDRTLHQSLGELAAFVEADRAYIFDYDWEAQTTSNTHEWCAEGIDPQIEELQDVPLEYVPQWVETHRRGETMFVPDVQALPPGDGLRDILEPQGIRSLIAIPIQHKGRLLGFVGFDSVRTHHHYTEKERSLLRVFAEILVNMRNRQEMEQTLVREKQRAQAASQAKSDFLANMSHEIRTPLNGIIGFLDLVRRTELTPLQDQYLENVAVSSQSLLSVINDILDFSKIEAGRMELDAVRTDLEELLDQTVDIVKLTAAQKGLELLVNRSPELPRFVVIDPSRLSQVLVNLLGNAVKFTERGEVELKVDFEALNQERGRFRFEVRDTGIGISEEQQGRLFQAFQQADTSTTRRFGGTGLGLVIANFLVGKMGGRIQLESHPGQGSRFYFSIETTYEAAPKEHGSLDRLRRVLVVDDHDKNRQLLEAHLEEWGLEVTSADNALNAMSALAQSGPFDAALVDYHMPFVDGLETIRMMREKMQLSPRELPVVLLHSSTETSQLQEACRELGVAFQLVKPVKARLLRQYLSQLHQKEAQAEPTSKAGPAPQSPSAPASSVEGGPLVLVVEDVLLNRELVKNYLRNLLPGARIVEAEHGEAALAQYQREKPDLIFMDIQMPVLSGLEATRHIREGDSGTPIIALTAGAVKEEEAQCRAAGMNDFLTKPLSQDALAEVLKRHLPGLFPF